MVRAKFRCVEIHRNLNGSQEVTDPETGKKRHVSCELRTIVLYPVYGGVPELGVLMVWIVVAPSGRLELGCINLAAAEAFQLGREYYLDFTPARKLKTPAPLARKGKDRRKGRTK